MSQSCEMVMMVLLILHTQLCFVDPRLPEGVRLLSVFLSADEYNDLVQHCSSSVVLQVNTSTYVEPTQPLLDSCSDRAIVHDEGHAVGFGVLNCGNISEGHCKKTIGEDSAEVLGGTNTGQSILQEGSHAESSAISGDMNPGIQQPCSDPVNAQTSGSVVAAVNQENHPTVTESTSTSDSHVDIPTNSRCAGDKNNELRRLELYIQGNSQTVFMLFTQQGFLSELDVIRDLVWIFYI